MKEDEIVGTCVVLAEEDCLQNCCCEYGPLEVPTLSWEDNCKNLKERILNESVPSLR